MCACASNQFYVYVFSVQMGSTEYKEKMAAAKKLRSPLMKHFDTICVLLLLVALLHLFISGMINILQRGVKESTNIDPIKKNTAITVNDTQGIVDPITIASANGIVVKMSGEVLHVTTPWHTWKPEIPHWPQSILTTKSPTFPSSGLVGTTLSVTVPQDISTVTNKRGKIHEMELSYTNERIDKLNERIESENTYKLLKEISELLLFLALLHLFNLL